MLVFSSMLQKLLVITVIYAALYSNNSAKNEPILFVKTELFKIQESGLIGLCVNLYQPEPPLKK